jgi:hypothetical protein
LALSETWLTPHTFLQCSSPSSLQTFASSIIQDSLAEVASLPLSTAPTLTLPESPFLRSPPLNLSVSNSPFSHHLSLF